MSEKCKPKYKNLNLIQSFSEQRYATVQLMEQACQNDEWLRQEVEKLSYLSPPAVRKRFSPVLVDENQSYGYQFSEGTHDENGNLQNDTESEVIFSEKTDPEIIIDFSDMSLIDENKSDCAFESYEDTEGISHYRAVVPMVESSNVNLDCANFKEGDQINSFWYVGYDKAKSYSIRPDWIKDWKDMEIPAVGRAQTIKIPNDITEGYLESVDLQLQNNGTTWSNWGSPLYVEIFKISEKKVQKTVWDKKTKKNKPYSPKQYETIAFPDSNPYTALACAEYQPKRTTPHFQNFLFDKAVKVHGGEQYAIVMSSPLSHYTHCPRIGGWGRNCAKSKDLNGDAFLTENNGRKWTRYGRNDSNVKYKEGRYTPSDFAYQCHIREYSQGRDTEADYYLYLKPILINPVKAVQISGEYDGETNKTSNDISLTFEGSINGREWFTLRSGEWKYFTENYPITIFIRAKMSVTSSGKTTLTPTIENMHINFKTDSPKEMYVRTHFFSPKLTPMLGASLWGRIKAPFSLSPDDGNVTCNVEIIQDKLITEHFTIISVEDLINYEYLEIFDSSKVKDQTDDKIVEYLEDNPSVINNLKKENIYIKPITLDEEDHLLSFAPSDESSALGGLPLSQGPAYPIQECMVQPDCSTANVVSYGEWYDFLVDYDDNIFTLDKSVLDDMPTGSLLIRYNPVFIDNLSLEEVSTRIDTETGLMEEGLILDYFKETIAIDSENVETRRVKLRVSPVDPIRQVILNKDTDDETELYEDVDFTVDYTSKELILPISSIEGEYCRLKENDSLEIIYTPNLEDTSIAIGYYAHRLNSNYQCRIKPNYFEYKV